MRIGDGGAWLRRQCIIMAQANSTPVTTWLDMTLGELAGWIDAHNEVARLREQEREKARGAARRRR